MSDQGTQQVPVAPVAPAARIAMRDLLNPLAIVIAGLMISGSTVWSTTRAPQLRGAESIAVAPVAEARQPAAPPVDISQVKIKGEPFIGDANAPVVIAYWFDYQCPYCRQEEEKVLPQLIADYVDTGKAKLVFKDFQFLGSDSQTAGLAARAVWEAAPDKFREWHKAMFDNQDDENAGWGKKDDIIAMTSTIPDIDSAKIAELMNIRLSVYSAEMDDDQAEGNAMGVHGTPSFLIGKQLIAGALPYAELKSAIDEVHNAK